MLYAKKQKQQNKLSSNRQSVGKSTYLRERSRRGGERGEGGGERVIVKNVQKNSNDWLLVYLCTKFVMLYVHAHNDCWNIHVINTHTHTHSLTHIYRHFKLCSRSLDIKYTFTFIYPNEKKNFLDLIEFMVEINFLNNMEFVPNGQLRCIDQKWLLCIQIYLDCVILTSWNYFKSSVRLVTIFLHAGQKLFSFFLFISFLFSATVTAAD